MRTHVLAVLCLGLARSAAANEDASASYDSQTRLLRLPLVEAEQQFWSVTLQDQGDYYFHLQTAIPYTGALPAVWPRFDTTSGMLTISDVKALGKTWAVSLQHGGNYTFQLMTAQPVSEAVPLPDDQTPEIPPLLITPKDRYTLHTDGTVTDTITGLQWMRCSLGQTWTGSGCSGNHLKLSEQGAAYAAFNTTFAGKSDWRLPSIDELKTLVYCTTGKPFYWNASGYRCEGDFQRPTLYAEAFPDSGGVYWSGTPLKADPGEDNTLTVSFNLGHVYYSYFNDDYESARFVRGDATVPEGPEVVGGYKETPCVTDICSTVPR